MAGVAQLVEHRFVAPDVAGSIPVARPTFRKIHISEFCFFGDEKKIVSLGPLAQLVEQLTLNQ